jgi:hypothetical protein
MKTALKYIAALSIPIAYNVALIKYGPALYAFLNR